MRMRTSIHQNILPTILVLALAGCASAGKRTARGGIAGAATGAVMGGAAGGAKGAAIGAAVGGAAGAAIGNYLDRRKKELDTVAPTEKTPEGLKVQLKNDILFGFDKSNVQPDAQEQLTKLAEILSKYPQDQLRIVGYTDDIGKPQYNQKLSERRAQSVMEFLASHGITKDRMEAIGKGELPPATKTAEAREKNRRVEIRIAVPEAQQAATHASNR